MESIVPNNLNSVQQKLIRTFEHLHDEKQLNELQSLINFYFEKKLDEAIMKVETDNNFTASTYEGWLKENNRRHNKLNSSL